jgi:GTP-binding protein
MPALCFEGATFVKSAVGWTDLPPADQPEVAMVGRSNAGKSSALNTLANRTRLAYVSKTPGRTQALNFFSLPKGGYVVDLPGYGYAKTARATKADWGPVLGRYVSERPNLVGVILLMDIRHPLTELDLGFLDWFAPAGKSLLVLLTKADKVSKQVKIETARDVKQAIANTYPDMSQRTVVEVFSSLKKLNTDRVTEVVAAWMALPPAHEENA